MGNSIFGYNNAIPRSQLVAGSSEAKLPVTRLGGKLGSFASGWQTQSSVTRSRHGAWVAVDALTEQNWKALLLTRTNLTSSAQVRWRAGSRDAIIPSTPLVDVRFTKDPSYVAQGPGTLTVARGTVGWRCRSDGVWEEVGVNLPRIHHNPRTLERMGLLAEFNSTNRIRNPRWEGLASPATPPTNMSVTTNGGISLDWLGWATQDGLPGVYVRLYGTATANGYARIYLETTTGIANTTGQIGSVSIFAWLAAVYAGTDTGVLGTVLEFQGLNNVGTVLGTAAGTLTDIRASRPGASRRILRGSVSGGATQTNARPYVDLKVADGATVDVGIWLSAPQFENSYTAPSSPMFPPVGAPAAFTRGSEVPSYTLPGGFIDSTKGTMVVDWMAGNVEPTLVHPGNQTGANAMQLDNGSTAERYLIRCGTMYAGAPINAGTLGTDFLAYVASAIVYDSPSYLASPPRAVDTYTDETPFRNALTYGGGGTIQTAYAGTVVDSGYSGSLPTGLTRIQASGTQNVQPCICRWRWFPDRFTAAQLAEVTNTGEALDPAGLSYDSGWLSNGIAPVIGQSCHLPAVTPSSRYVRFDIEDPTNPDGFINVPLAYAGSVWEPTHAVDWSSSMAPKVMEQVLESRAGQEYVEVLFRQRVWDLAMSALKGEEVWVYQQELDRVASTGENVLFLPDKTSPYANSEAVFGILKSLAPVGYSAKSTQYRNWRARISERL